MKSLLNILAAALALFWERSARVLTHGQVVELQDDCNSDRTELCFDRRHRT
jgi:hypothetical protein